MKILFGFGCCVFLLGETATAAPRLTGYLPTVGPSPIRYQNPVPEPDMAFLGPLKHPEMAILSASAPTGTNATALNATNMTDVAVIAPPPMPEMTSTNGTLTTTIPPAGSAGLSQNTGANPPGPLEGVPSFQYNEKTIKASDVAGVLFPTTLTNNTSLRVFIPVDFTPPMPTAPPPSSSTYRSQ